ncbi:uncharacterized protein LOC128840876 [Malaclemys terrapin pileata]|uniref:uncharacterized protein LOC128840876 n=1 Tax=Malaclemys terrapin pileata TaxID=2991368 RepID=UPI0023A8B8CF|nr:uncharacterized protein LOC128840876 [Malaclemys terrapin pileata]
MQRLGAVPCSRNTAPSPHVGTHLSGPWFSQAWSPHFAATRGSAFHPSDLQSSVRRQREPEDGSAWPVAPHPKANSSGNLTGSSTSWEPPSLAPLLTPPPARRPRGWTGCEGWNGAGKFIFGDCSEPSSRRSAPGKGQQLQAPPGPGHGRSSGRTRGQMARWSRGRESSPEFAEEPAAWLPCTGPGAGTSGGCPGWREQARSPGGTGELQPLLMETPAAHAALGEDMDWADVSLPCTARLAPRVQRMGPGLPGAPAVPCCSRIAKPQRTGELCASTYHCLTAPACPGHALHAALCPHPCLGEIPPISTGRTTGTSQALSSPGPADLSHPPAVCSQTALRMALGPALQGWGGSWSCCVAGRGCVPGGFPRPLPV